MDGWGLSEQTQANAVVQARTPNFDRMWEKYPSSTLITHGEAVGLPADCVGNSEVGHLHIGAGRTIYMDMQRINAAIADESFYKEDALLKFANKVCTLRGRAHVAGLVTEVGVHALFNHLVAAVHALNRLGLDVSVHAFTDGRDSAPRIANKMCSKLASILPTGVNIDTVCGRYWAMDRDQRWDRIQRAWSAIINGHGEQNRECEPKTAILDTFQWKENDEFINPSARLDYHGMKDGDGIFFINFRSDRIRQLASSIADPEFNQFDVSSRPKVSAALGMVSYFAQPKQWIDDVYAKPKISNTLGSWVADHGLRQIRIAETEKYPHVTYFLNGGKEQPEPGEDWFMAQSPLVATYDLAPEMAAKEVCNKFTEAIQSGYDLIVVNFANPDMVGHTGDLSAAIKACETVDQAIGKAEEEILKIGGTMIVTADHGNCEVMVEEGEPHTAHTTNPVPIILVGGPTNIKLHQGTLTDLAPTILQLMDLYQPPEMTGKSLVEPQDFIANEFLR